MEPKKLEKLYDLIINQPTINNNVLMQNGFTEDEVEFLLKNNIIKATETQEFQVVNIKDLYGYGVKLLIYRNYKLAQVCFEKCHELDPSDRNACLQLILMRIQFGHFSKVFEMFDNLEAITTDIDKCDNNLYLYMFSLLTGCPEKYHQRLAKLNYDSILITNQEGISNVEYENRIRTLIMKSKLKFALKLLNDKMARNRKYSIRDELLKTLLVKVIQANKIFKAKLLELAQNNEFYAILSFINNKSFKRCLTSQETYIQIIVEAILEIQKTQEIPEPSICQTDYIYEAIIGNNFPLALELEEKFITKNNVNRNEDIICLLLTEINQLISNIQKENATQKMLIK